MTRYKGHVIKRTPSGAYNVYYKGDWVAHGTELKGAKFWVDSYGANGKKSSPHRRNPGLADSIRAGDRVTIVDRFGKQSSGRAVMRGPAGWVLNMGGRYGTPALADDSNVIRVKGSKPAPDTLRLRSFTGEVKQNPDGTVVIIGAGPKPAGARRINPGNPGNPGWSISAIKSANRAAGLHYFDKSTMQFFNGKVDSNVYQGTGGVYFVSSSQFVGSDGRAHARVYKVAKFHPDSSRVEHAGGSQHTTLADARDEAKSRSGASKANPAAFDRCVKAVKRKGGAFNAYAVCRAARKKRRNPARTFRVDIPATRYDKGYRLTITAKTKASARAEAKRYCSGRWAKYTGRPASQYKLPSKTKVVEA